MGEEGGGGGNGGGNGGGGHGGAHEAEPVVTHGAGHGGAQAGNDHQPPPLKTSRTTTTTVDDEFPISPRVVTPNPFSRKNTSLDLDDYFVSQYPRLELRCIGIVT
jgi:ion channel-forming bestrophin family protein